MFLKLEENTGLINPNFHIVTVADHILKLLAGIICNSGYIIFNFSFKISIHTSKLLKSLQIALCDTAANISYFQRIFIFQDVFSKNVFVRRLPKTYLRHFFQNAFKMSSRCLQGLLTRWLLRTSPNRLQENGLQALLKMA